MGSEQELPLVCTDVMHNEAVKLVISVRQLKWFCRYIIVDWIIQHSGGSGVL
jgi:hypothetical protein